MPECSGCGRAAEFRCGRCKQAAYCNESCQTAAWRGHSIVCGRAVGLGLDLDPDLIGRPRLRPSTTAQRRGHSVRDQPSQDAARLGFLVHILKDKFPRRIGRILDTDGTIDTAKLRDEARRMGISPDVPVHVAFSKLSKMWQGDDAPLSELTWFDPNGLPPNLLLNSRLGVGSYGEVWLATEVTSNRQYAAKILADDDDLDDEGVILQWVNTVTRAGAENPNVLGYVGAWKNWVPPGSRSGLPRPLLVSEYINGSELIDVFNTNEANDWRPWFDINWYAEQLFNGVAFLHQKGIAHRDLKMDNVMVHAPYRDSDGRYRYGRIVIIDLGLSCVVDNVSREARLIEKACTQEHTLTQGGAWVYLSPEIADFYIQNRVLAMEDDAALAGIPTPDLSIQYSNDVWAAALCILGVIIGDYPVRYLAPTILDGGDDADYYLATIRELHGSSPEVARALAVGKRNIDVAVRDLADGHLLKTREEGGAERRRWESALTICAEMSALCASAERRASAEAVHRRLRRFNETSASASPPQVWRDGNALEASELTPYDVVI